MLQPVFGCWKSRITASTITSPFSLIGTAIRFARKQPVLRGVVFWFILVPGAAVNVIATILQRNDMEGFAGLTPEQQGMLSVLLVVCLLLLAVVMLWGGACVLLIGRKLVHSRAGRNRTSLRAVGKEARAFVIPLILTQILRSCIALLWGILLVVPGILYLVRTAFYDIIVTTEGAAYRAALHKSRDVVKGQTGSVLWRLLVFLVVLYVPVNALSMAGYWLVEGLDENLILIMDVIDAALNAPVTVLYILSSMALYDTLKSTEVRK